MLDLFLWGYSGTYTPLYRREGASAIPQPAPSRPPPVVSETRWGVELFRDDDDGYLRWLAEHPKGFVLNAARTPRADSLILHRATCRTITGKPTRGGPWTGPYRA